MLETMLDRHIIFVLMGILTAVGIVSKCIVNVALKRLVRAAGNMNKSTHPLMRLVRAKFEHASMVSDKVENVKVFVDKYLYEYKVLGFRLHTWRRMEKAAAGLCLLVGAAGAGLEYSLNGMSDVVWKTGAVGGGLAALIYLVHLLTDEKYQMEAVQNYMVDFLENVCRHRFEKSYQKEIKVLAQEGSSAEFGVMPAEGQGGAGDTYAVRKKENMDDGAYAVRKKENVDDGTYAVRKKENIDDSAYAVRNKENIDDGTYAVRKKESMDDNLYAVRNKEAADDLYNVKKQEAVNEREQTRNPYAAGGREESENPYAARGREQTDEPYTARTREPSQGQSAVSAFLAAELKAGEAVFRTPDVEPDEAVNAFRSADLGVDIPVNASRASEPSQREMADAFRITEPSQNETANTFYTPGAKQNDAFDAFRTSEPRQKETVEIETPRGRENRKENIVEIPVPESAKKSMDSVILDTPEASNPPRNAAQRQTVQKERMTRKEKGGEEIDRDIVIRRILEEFMA